MLFPLEFHVTQLGEGVPGLFPTYEVFLPSGVTVVSGNMSALPSRPGLYVATPDLPEGRYFVCFQETSEQLLDYQSIEVTDIQGRLTAIAQQLQDLSSTPVLLPQALWENLQNLPRQTWNFNLRSLTGYTELPPDVTSRLLSLPTNPLLESDSRLPTEGKIASQADVVRVEDKVRFFDALRIVDGEGKAFSYLSGRVSLDHIHFSISVHNTADAPLHIHWEDFHLGRFHLLRLPSEFAPVLSSLVISHLGDEVGESWGKSMRAFGGEIFVSWGNSSSGLTIPAGESLVFSVTVASPYLSILDSWKSQRYFDSTLATLYSQVESATTVMQIFSAFSAAREYLRGLGVSVRELPYGRIW